MVKGVICSSRKRQSNSLSSSTASGERVFKVEDKAAKSNKPLQKTGRFFPVPLDSPRIKRIATNVEGALSWVRSQANSLSHQSEAENASKREYVGPYRSNPSVSRRSLGRKCRAFPVFHNNCLSPGVRPPTKSTRNGGGGGKSSARELAFNQDEASRDGHVESRHGNTIDTQTTPSDLLGKSQAVGKSFEQIILCSNFPSNKTSWETISEALESAKCTSTIFNRIFKVVGDKLESDNPSSSIKSAEVPYTIDTESDELYLSLSNNFDEMSNAAVNFCLRAISLVAKCLEDCQDIKDCVASSLFEAALEFLSTYSRIIRVQEKMIVKRKGVLAVIGWSKEQEESRAEHLWKLIEAASRNVITVQNRVLQSALAQPLGTATSKEETSNVVSHLQRSWTWLNRISKRVTVLCPSRKRILFVYLLERFTEATGELARYQKLLPVLNDAHCKARLAIVASSCQRMLLQSLMQLFKSAEEVGLKLSKEGLVAAFDFSRIAKASHIYSITLTLLLSAIAEQPGTTVSESRHFSEILRRYRVELRSFAIPCMAVIQQLAIESPNHALVPENSLDRLRPDFSNMKKGAGYQLYTGGSRRLKVLFGIAAGMAHMDKPHIVHRDLTSPNVLLDNVDKTGSIGVYICDFERARYLPGGEDVRRTKSCANSAPWMGPELFRK